MTLDWTTTPVTETELAAVGAKLDRFATTLAPREKLVLASLLGGLTGLAAGEVQGYDELVLPPGERVGRFLPQLAAALAHAAGVVGSGPPQP